MNNNRVANPHIMLGNKDRLGTLDEDWEPCCAKVETYTSSSFDESFSGVSKECWAWRQVIPCVCVASRKISCRAGWIDHDRSVS